MGTERIGVSNGGILLLSHTEVFLRHSYFLLLIYTRTSDKSSRLITVGPSHPDAALTSFQPHQGGQHKVLTGTASSSLPEMWEPEAVGRRGTRRRVASWSARGLAPLRLYIFLIFPYSEAYVLERSLGWLQVVGWWLALPRSPCGTTFIFLCPYNGTIIIVSFSPFMANGTRVRHASKLHLPRVPQAWPGKGHIRDQTYCLSIWRGERVIVMFSLPHFC